MKFVFFGCATTFAFGILFLTRRKAYCRLLGRGLIIIGAGIAVTGVFTLFESPLWWIPITIGFAAGLFIMHKAQMKFNGGWF